LEIGERGGEHFRVDAVFRRQKQWLANWRARQEKKALTRTPLRFAAWADQRRAAPS
jgi:hypothetical protein